MLGKQRVRRGVGQHGVAVARAQQPVGQRELFGVAQHFVHPTPRLDTRGDRQGMVGLDPQRLAVCVGLGEQRRVNTPIGRHTVGETPHQ